ncbi:uncharacterized protein LOC129913608 isoform X2 [Episyrphus balteatus]|uniref:uncharacterized protein LOC129913608 isoform X2 n=1 Tax=Episyrphus balteatus TaxID=286459 RepID=UPI002485FA70|nr:uncharacterized protein LOC129913608 isoform X2 [Episyrphus balteatus]
MKSDKMQFILFTMWEILMALLVVPSLGRQHSSSLVHGGTVGGKDSHVKTKDIEAVEGKSVTLPCPIEAPLQDVYMVLWFRDNAGIPLYSFDVRDKLNTEQPRHWSAPEVFGSRAKFLFDTSPASLEIKDIKRHDQGIYRCRIDFRTSQTQSFRFNLSVIILPEQPIILDRWGRQLNGTQLGPKQEGDDIVITCRVVGGRPQPQVRWLVNGLLVDNQYEHNSGDVIENRLLWPSVQRTDLNSVFTCQALNTQLDKPKEKSFLLDMHLKPLTVKIVDPPVSMVADRRYEVMCESSGSRPNAIITWYKGKRQLRRTKDEILNNTTHSELSFVPTTDDDGKSITCRSENPNVNGLFLETLWKLNVVYPPLVTLRLGSTLSPDDIKEGDDVYFECHVQSNPQWRKLLWLHNGIHLEHNTSARVIRSNQSLVLQKITKHYAGNYACSAINDEGETVSNHLPLRVKYTPICKHLDRVALIGASKDETVEVICEIQADPPPRSFRWKFNNSGETLDVGSERFSVNGSRSILKYTPVTDQDYGTLSCWAANEVGTQHQPCLFQVVLAGLPSAVSNCTVYNRTELSVDIQCLPGYDGGLPQIFVLEMFSSRTGGTRLNLTNPEEPQFILESLDTLTTMMTTENNSMKIRIYSFNQKGRSPAYYLTDFVIGSAGHKSDDISFSMSPVIVGCVLTFIVISLAIAMRIFLVTFLNNLRRNRQHGTKGSTSGGVQSGDGYKKSGNLEKPRWQHTDIKTKSSSDDLIEDERDPDVIPSQFVGSGGGGNSSNGLTDLHFTTPPMSKWSPNANHRPYDTLLHQGTTTASSTSTNGPPGVPVTYNQINSRPHLMSSSVISPTSIVGGGGSGGGLGVGTSSLTGVSPNGLGMIIASPTSSAASTATLPATSTSLTNVMPNVLAATCSPVGGAGGGISGGSTMPSLIGGTLPSSGSGPGCVVGSGGSFLSNTNSLSRAMLHQQQQQHQHQQQQQHHHHHSLGRNSNLQPQFHQLTSLTGASSSLQQQPPQLSAKMMAMPPLPGGLVSSSSGIVSGCSSSSDLEDNININAIKDCLMTQRVPESCV